MKSVSFLSLQKVCGWLDIVRYMDKESTFVEDGGPSARLQPMYVLGPVIMKSLNRQVTKLSRNSLLETGFFIEFHCITRAIIE